MLSDIGTVLREQPLSAKNLIGALVTAVLCTDFVRSSPYRRSIVFGDDLLAVVLGNHSFEFWSTLPAHPFQSWVRGGVSEPRPPVDPSPDRCCDNARRF